MKRIIYVICVAAIAVSCLGNSPSVKRTYVLDVNFEYGDNVFQSDSVRFEEKEGTCIGYQDFLFYHKLNSQKTQLLGGFVVSRLKGYEGARNRNDFRVNRGVGLNGSPTYAVYKSAENEANMPEHDIFFANRDYGTCTVLGFYVNNTAEVVDSVKANFKPGDRLTLKATGYLNGAKTGEAEFSLAEYSNDKDSIVVRWTPFDLDKLGEVEYVDFEISSTSPNIPASFCMDDLVANISLEY